MTQKEYLLKLLEGLKSFNDNIDGLILLLNKDEITNNDIDFIIISLKSIVKSITNSKEKQKYEKSITIIENIRKREKETQEDLSELEKILGIDNTEE